MADDSGEQVTLILPSGKKQAFLIPSGMSDNEAKVFVRSKRPDLFQSSETSLVTGQGMEARATQQAKQVLTGTGEQGNYDATGRKISGPNGEPISYMEKVFQEKADQQTRLGSAMNRAAQSPTPITSATALYAPVAAARAIAGAKVGGYGAKQATSALGGGETAQNVAELGGNVVGGIAGAGGPNLLKWITSSKTAGAKALQAASAKAGNATVELSPRTNELVDDIVKEGSSGGSPPKVVSDLLKRLGPAPGQAAEAVPGPLTYNEARIFQGNLSQLSVAEQQSLKGRMGGLIKQLAKSFGSDVQAGADAAGAGPEHAIGMKEYAAASARNRALVKGAKVAGVAGGTIGGVYELMRMLQGSK